MPKYDPCASYDDASCPPVISACTDSTAVRYRPTPTVDNARCQYAACMHPNAARVPVLHDNPPSMATDALEP